MQTALDTRQKDLAIEMLYGHFSPPAKDSGKNRDCGSACLKINVESHSSLLRRTRSTVFVRRDDLIIINAAYTLTLTRPILRGKKKLSTTNKVFFFSLRLLPDRAYWLQRTPAVWILRTSRRLDNNLALIYRDNDGIVKIVRRSARERDLLAQLVTRDCDTYRKFEICSRRATRKYLV